MTIDRALTAAVYQQEEWYVAQCLEADVASQGRSMEEALNNLRAAVRLYLSCSPEPVLSDTPVVAAFHVSGVAA